MKETALVIRRSILPLPVFITMDLFHRKKNLCDQCGEKFESYDELIKHSRYVHHHIVKYCGKEFVHEKDRLHHTREEHQKELEYRTHRDEYTHKMESTQEQVDEHTKSFGDNF